jgi:hypothetical protein
MPKESHWNARTGLSPWILLVGVVGLAIGLASFPAMLAHKRQLASMEGTLELLAAEIRFQNHQLQESLVSTIRKEMEAGNKTHAQLIPVAQQVRSVADSLAENHPAEVNWFIGYADSIYQLLETTRQLVPDTLHAAALSSEQQRIHIRLVERGLLHTLRTKQVRILSVADTLTALTRPQALEVPRGQDFRMEIQPYWSASGLHPYESYQFRADRGKLTPSADGNRAMLIIPTDTLLPPDSVSRWVSFSFSVSLPTPYGQRREVNLESSFLVTHGCE